MGKNKIIYIAIAIIILIGVIIGAVKGFNIELLYQNRQEIIISNNTGLDTAKILDIAKSVLGDKKVKVQKVERFGNAVQIAATQITDEEKQAIIDKVNEEYGLDISQDQVDTVTVPATRIRDILKPYILPGVISFVIVLIYFGIVYNKQGIGKVLLKAICIPILAEVTFYAIVAITRVPFGRVVNAIAIGVYAVSILILTMYFQKNKGTSSNKDELKQQ